MTKMMEHCRQLGCGVRENVPMAGYTSFKIGGPAQYFVSADPYVLSKVWRKCRENDIPVFVLGNGSNILVSDSGVSGIVLHMGEAVSPPEIREDGVLLCPAGLPLKKLCLFARDNGLSGLEFAYGIPGSVGGGIYMNAGAYGGQMADVLLWVRAVGPDGNAVIVSADEMKMGYRHSIFMEEDAVIVEAAFRLAGGEPPKIAGVMDGIMYRRRSKQPLEYPSAGSFFKRPKGYFAGELIEKCGMKGYTVGGAQISEKHAGFIINRKGATCDDVRRLADDVSSRVLKEYGVLLEPEVRYI